MSPAPVATRSFRIRPAPAANLPGLTRQKLTFAYDARGRRILKRVFNWNTSTSIYTLNSETKFLYDGWNLLAEYNGMNANALVRSYVWGPDLSGSMQGAGGVGGLLWATVAPGSTSPAPGDYAPAYDGNGNIVAWIDLADSSVDGKRDFGAFGESVLATGPAASLPFAFSTKYRDVETELYYYGFRFYNPSTGRWLNRDPIEQIKGKKAELLEEGPNIYAFIANNGISSSDPSGLDRYITQFDLADIGGSGGTQLHVGVAVDTWKVVDGKYVKDGVISFDFSVDWDDWIEIIKGITIGGRGRVVETSGLVLEAPTKITSSPCQDIKMLKLLRRDVHNPPKYVALTHQCIKWSADAIGYGWDQPDIKHCCPSAGN